jgi:penicillin amidase
MSSRVRSVLIGIITVFVVLAILLPLSGVVIVRRSFPRTRGQVKVDGLQAQVEILRDRYGIPHIYASNTRDLFFAQGYVHAQERFWQMDFWRHIGSARLSEMFGESQLDTDRFLRTLGWARVAQRELDQSDTFTRTILEAYAAGVNAYLAERQGSALSLEYAVLGLMNRGYQPEPWQPLHSLTWAKVMAWDLGGNLDGEIERAILSASLSAEQVNDLYPLYPEKEHPLIVPQPSAAPGSGSLGQPAPTAGLPSQALDLLRGLDRRQAGLRALLGPGGPGIGSNSWVVSGKLTDTGKPLLANDPHLGIQMPAIWYQVGLHCQPVGPECPFQVTGFSFAGAPGVIIGHNARIAWAFTNVGPDVQDLYIEKINPANPDQYEYQGQWVNMELVKETIQVAGGDPVEITVRYTRHGPVISETYGGLEGFAEQAGVALPNQFAIALRWTALESGGTFPSIWRLNLAQNWEEFRQALSTFAAPSQNVLYADVDGNIGYQTPGSIPIRLAGDGVLPVPGWSGEYEWSGYIPYAELPFAYNPPQGYLVTANNAVVGSNYPYLITTDWDHGYRAERIVQMIEQAPRPITLQTLAEMQGDNRAMNVDYVLPVLLRLQPSDERLVKAQELLRNWDGQMHMDSAPAALYAAFWRQLLISTFQDNLPEDIFVGGDSRGFELIRKLVVRSNSAWWDDLQTLETEDMQAIFARAFEAAVREIEQLQGADPAGWRWGDLHTAAFENQTLGKSGIGPIEGLFNRGPFPASGGSSIVNATGWSILDPYGVTWLPSMRMLVDLSNLQASLAVNTTGQSGHAYHAHYIDMSDLWRNIEYHPMHWEREAIEKNLEGRLVLAPP